MMKVIDIYKAMGVLKAMRIQHKSNQEHASLSFNEVGEIFFKALKTIYGRKNYVMKVA